MPSNQPNLHIRKPFDPRNEHRSLVAAMSYEFLGNSRLFKLNESESESCSLPAKKQHSLY